MSYAGIALNKVAGWFSSLSTKGKLAMVIVTILSIDSIFMAWSDRRPVGAFFESFMAMGLYWAIGIGGLFGSIWAGVTYGEKKKSKVLGWMVGLACFAAATFAFYLTTKIPGVGWRIEKMMESSDLGDY
jgi:hypothetical protein